VTGAGGRPAGVEEDVEEHRDKNTACVLGTIWVQDRRLIGRKMPR
jgi:hypothetical protein